MENNEKLKKYLDHYNAQIYTSYTDEDNCSFHVYREDTADGYEVFIAKYKSDSTINIMDDVSAEETISMWVHDEGLDTPTDGSIDNDYHYKLKK